MADATPPDWRLVCTAWQPSAGDDDPRRLGFADLLLPGGFVLRRVSLLRTAAGPIRAAAPHIHKRGPSAFSFASDAGWREFSAAVVEAVRAAHPAALPDHHPDPAPPPAPILAH